MTEEETYSVGVIVGRFQVPELHHAHLNLIETVCSRHSKVIIYLGLAPILSTLNNPLPYEARKQMIQEEFPDVDIHYIKDHPSDEQWSKNLDGLISDVITPSQTVLLYGGRESFIPHYHGRFQTTELAQNVYVSGTSGTQERRKVHVAPTRPTSDFRAGVIWATSNRYANPLPTVDCALFLDGDPESKNKADIPFAKLVLGRKTIDPKDKVRFIGGFVEADETTLEANCRREVGEEANVECTDPIYIASVPINDWRYRGEKQKILTSFFYAHKMFGQLAPGDDIEELIVIDYRELMTFEKINKSDGFTGFVSEHIVLRDTLESYMRQVNNVFVWSSPDSTPETDPFYFRPEATK